jgi:integrase
MTAKKLKDTEIRRAIAESVDRSYSNDAKNRLLGDGDGLYLSISKKGTASWLYRYYSDGKAKAIGLGGYPTTTLAIARDKAAEVRTGRALGNDPHVVKKTRAVAANHEASSAKTFEKCALDYIEHAKDKWRNPKHKQQWISTLTQFAFPVIGKTPVADVNKELIVEILLPIWQDKNETASRLRGRIEMVLAWAAANDLRSDENPARYKGLLEHRLPKVRKAAERVHHPSLPYEKLSDFMDELYKLEDMSRYALELLILCASRTNEITHAEWSEFDLTQGIWTIPGARMKAGLEHKIPLCPRAIEILNHIRGFSGERYVFITRGKDKPMSNMAMAMLCRRMKYTQITVHGFRSTFRNWAGEQTEYPFEVCEQALSHGLKSGVARAYLRTDFYVKRTNLMNDWAKFVLQNINE